MIGHIGVNKGYILGFVDKVLTKKIVVWHMEIQSMSEYATAP